LEVRGLLRVAMSVLQRFVERGVLLEQRLEDVLTEIFALGAIISVGDRTQGFVEGP
jgi:hypothetical protein